MKTEPFDGTAPPTPEQAHMIMTNMVEALQRAQIATRNLLLAVTVLGAANAALVICVIMLLRRG